MDKTDYFTPCACARGNVFQTNKYTGVGIDNISTPVSCTCIASQPLPCLPVHACTSCLLFHANTIPILKFQLLVIHVSLDLVQMYGACV